MNDEPSGHERGPGQQTSLITLPGTPTLRPGKCGNERQRIAYAMWREAIKKCITFSGTLGAGAWIAHAVLCNAQSHPGANTGIGIAALVGATLPLVGKTWRNFAQRPTHGKIRARLAMQATGRIYLDGEPRGMIKQIPGHGPDDLGIRNWAQIQLPDGQTLTAWAATPSECLDKLAGQIYAKILDGSTPDPGNQANMKRETAAQIRPTLAITASGELLEGSVRIGTAKQLGPFIYASYDATDGWQFEDGDTISVALSHGHLLDHVAIQCA